MECVAISEHTVRLSGGKRMERAVGLYGIRVFGLHNAGQSLAGCWVSGALTNYTCYDCSGASRGTHHWEAACPLLRHPVLLQPCHQVFDIPGRYIAGVEASEGHVCGAARRLAGLLGSETDTQEHSHAFLKVGPTQRGPNRETEAFLCDIMQSRSASDQSLRVNLSQSHARTVEIHLLHL